MKVGAMRHRIGVYTRAQTLDSYGQEIETFTLSTTRWGAVEITGNQKGEAYEGQAATDSIEITMREVKTMTLLGRVTALGATYSITQIINVDGLGKEYRVSAERLR